MFEEGADMLQALLRLDISGKQIQRVSEYYGHEIEELEQQDNEKQVLALKDPQKAAYCKYNRFFFFLCVS